MLCAHEGVILLGGIFYAVFKTIFRLIWSVGEGVRGECVCVCGGGGVRGECVWGGVRGECVCWWGGKW